MNNALNRLNNLAPAEAEALFRDCCGSRRWAERMALSRPFASEEELLALASSVWNDLDAEDWLEAFSSHPKIGEAFAASGQTERSTGWSACEQAGVDDADLKIKADLARANRLYEEKFKCIFIVCASGKNAREMLDICRRRLQNEPEVEMPIAAEEQQKITEIRLKKLLSP